MRSQEFRSRAFETGAVLTAAMVAFMGRVGLKPAMAMPEAHADTPAHINTIDKTHLPKPAPEGVKVLNNHTQIELENLKAFINLKHRWDGVVMVHAPKTDANIGFANSPSAYDVCEPGYGFLYHTDKSALEVDGPGIEIFNGRPYLAINCEGPQWGWADLDWLMQNKAVDFYQYVGQKPRAVAYNPGTSAMKPKLKRWETAPSPAEFGAAFDLNGHLRQLRPSKIVPHVSQ
jgi:hypothetical protein